MKKFFTPLKAIRQNCLDCSGGSPKVVRECDIEDCPLHPFRFGKNPKRKGIGFAKKIRLKVEESNISREKLLKTSSELMSNVITGYN